MGTKQRGLARGGVILRVMVDEGAKIAQRIGWGWGEGSTQRSRGSGKPRELR